MQSPAILLISAILVTSATPGFAQTARSGGSSSANAQAMQQLQQLASERTQLQAEMSKLKAELEAARKERDTLKKTQEGVVQRTRGAESELARAQADNARLEGDVAREKQRVEELVTRFREAAGTMREVETDRATKTQSLAQREQELTVCTDRNAKLYALNGEVLGKLEDDGFWSSLARREPFTRLKRVELENLVDGYRGSAEDNRVPAAGVKR